MENLIILPQRKISRFVQIVGFIFFSILFYFSWHFYLERMLAFDGAYSDFNLIESGMPVAGIGRYGDWIPLLLPWLALKLNMPLSNIILAHSISFIILHYLIFLFVTLKLKHDGAGIAIMLVSCLGYYHTFYNPMVELNESLIAGILLWAFIHPEYPYSTARERRMGTIGAIVTIIYMSYLHPLGIFEILFVLGIEMIGYRRYKDSALWIIILLGLGYFMLKFFVISRQNYDQERLVSFHTIIEQLPNWKNWPSTAFVDSFYNLHFRSLKWLVIICMVLTLRKGLLLFLFSIVFVIVFTLMYLVTLYQGASIVIYENYFISYGFFAGLMFIFLVYHPHRKNLVLLLTLPLLWVSVKRIYHGHNLYSDRLAYISRLVTDAHKNNAKKCLVDSKCYPYEYGMPAWNVAIETLLYSSLDGPDSSASVFIEEPQFKKVCDSLKNKKESFFGVHFAPVWISPKDFYSSYFNLPDEKYTTLTHSQTDSGFHENIYSAKNIKIVPINSVIHANQHDWVTAVPLEVVNTSGDNIPAIAGDNTPIYLSYKLYNAQGRRMYDSTFTYLETDVKNKLVCAATVYLPSQGGTYYAKFDFITKGVRWWNIRAEPVKIIID